MHAFTKDFDLHDHPCICYHCTHPGTNLGTNPGTDLGLNIGLNIGLNLGTDLGTDLGLNLGTDLGTNRSLIGRIDCQDASSAASSVCS